MSIIVTTTGSGNARDYAWLKQSIADWTHRADLDAKMADFVMLAEEQINQDLRTMLQDAIATLTTIPGAPFVLLPPHVRAVQKLSIPGQGALDYLTPGQFDDLYANGGGGSTRHYTQIGESLRLGPAPSGLLELSAIVRAIVPPLVDTGDGVNWLIARYPNLYLAATMVQACIFTRNPDLGTWQEKYAQAITALSNSDTEAAPSMALRCPVNSR